ncbi:UNVERIFIED_CONTAM: hypothetical protein HDU68_001443, partial [Siphonaria sp. JEL0065]
EKVVHCMDGDDPVSRRGIRVLDSKDGGERMKEGVDIVAVSFDAEVGNRGPGKVEVGVMVHFDAVVGMNMEAEGDNMDRGA